MLARPALPRLPAFVKLIDTIAEDFLFPLLNLRNIGLVHQYRNGCA